MKITNRDNGAAAMLLVKQERAIFRGVRGSQSFFAPAGECCAVAVYNAQGWDGFLSLSHSGGWGVLMSSSVYRSWWGRDCRDTQTHVVHPSQLYHLWHANDDHVNWGHANQSHANQGHANQGPANEVNPGHRSSILGKGLDYWDVALWCQLTAFQG